MRLLFFLFLLGGLRASAFMIPDSIITDWKNPGSNTYSLPGTNVVSILNFGGKNDSSQNNNTPLKAAISNLGANGGTVFFPAGKYRFDSTIQINQDKIILLGAGADQTKLYFNLNTRDNNCIQSGGSATAISTAILNTVPKGERSLYVNSGDAFSVGDWIFVKQGDSTYFTSDWAFGKFMQIARIDSILGNRIVINKPVRHTFFLSLNPTIQKMNPRKNIGIECMKLTRIDQPAAGQSSIIFLNYTVNSWVKGIESEKCQFAHITLEYSSNVSVLNSYFHHAFTYDGGGRGYGCVLQFGASNNLIQNNVFKHLRHGVLLQVSPNGNVIGYNYLFEPYWDQVPTNSAGQLVLHGNYPFTNLFEGNICENIVIDDSHGLNGPYNTYLRNRATGYGIFMTAGVASRTNFVGNEITGTLYTITGQNNYLYGNNNKGSIAPSNITSLPDTSYYLATIPPDFWTLSGTLPTIGYPKPYNTGNIPAKSRYTASPAAPFLCDNSCVLPAPTLNMQGSYVISPGDSIIINSTPAASLNWTYSGSNLSVVYLTNSIKIKSDATTTNGTLSFFNTNVCGNSAPQTSKLTISVSTGIFSNKLTSIKVYPNPNSGLLTIEQAKNRTITYSLLNVLGQQIRNGETSANRNELNFTNESKGVYLLFIRDENTGEQNTWRLVKN